MGSKDHHLVLERVTALHRLSIGGVEADENVAQVGYQREADVIGLKGRIGEHVGRAVHAAVTPVVLCDGLVVHQDDGEAAAAEPELSEQCAQDARQPSPLLVPARLVEDLHCHGVTP